MAAQNMSQWMADQRKCVASEVGIRSLLTPLNSISPSCRAPFFPRSFTLSFGIRCSCPPEYSLYTCLHLIPLQTVACFSFFLMSLLLLLLCTSLPMTLWLLTVRKTTSGFLIGSTYAPKRPHRVTLSDD